MLNKLNLISDIQVGSKAYGLHTENSDDDRKGVFLGTFHSILGIDKIQQFVIKNETQDYQYFDLKFFVSKAITGSMTWIELLFNDNGIVFSNKYWQRLLFHRDDFIGKNAYNKSYGFLKGSKLDPKISTKERCHSLRIADMLIEYADTKVIQIDRTKNREYYLSIKNGERDLDFIQNEIQIRMEKIDNIFQKLPEDNFVFVNDVVANIYLDFIKETYAN